MEHALICIAGKNRIAVEGAGHILKSHPKVKLVGCCNQNDGGRDGLQPSFRKWCLENNVPLLSLPEVLAQEQLIFISLEFDKILPVHVSNTKKLFNIHFSLLPKYKGMYTSCLPILYGEKSTGVSLHQIDAGIDTGPILDQQEFPICPQDTARDLYMKYLFHGFGIFKKNLSSLLQGGFSASPQPSFGASYFSKDAVDFKKIAIDLQKTAFEVSCQIRAFTFQEFQMVELFGRTVTGCEITGMRSTKKPGTLLSQTKEALILATIDFDLIIFAKETPKL